MSLALLLACSSGAATPGTGDHALAPVPQPTATQEVAVLAGGCFWCLESDMDKLAGVVSTTSGFAAGRNDAPTYDQVGMGGTGHTEVVYVVFEPKVVSYDQVLDWFWRHHDPTDGRGQFCDRGDQYRPGIYPQSPAQLVVAEASKKKIADSGALKSPIATEIVAGQKFWPAEIYHQDFYLKSADHYLRYRTGCGRDAKVAQVWGSAPGH
jgi:methionine-S-sulfoxide reductase